MYENTDRRDLFRCSLAGAQTLITLDGFFPLRVGDRVTFYTADSANVHRISINRVSCSTLKGVSLPVYGLTGSKIVELQSNDTNVAHLLNTTPPVQFDGAAARLAAKLCADLSGGTGV